LINAIFSFTGIYFNIKNRPHHTLSKDEAKVSARQIQLISHIEVLNNAYGG
jgi:hypothetical protein